MPKRDGDRQAASNGAGACLCRPLPPKTSRSLASTRLLRASRCVVGTCRPRVAARRPSRPPPRHRGGPRRRSGFPRSARSGDRRSAGRGAGSPRDSLAASGRRSRRREDLSAPSPNFRRQRFVLEPPASERLRQPVFPSVLVSACASSRLDRSCLDWNITRTIVESTKSRRSKKEAVGGAGLSEPWPPVHLESGICIGVHPPWPPAPTGKASCVCPSSPAR